MAIIDEASGREIGTGAVEVTLDLYRDVHKGIRTELFRVTTLAGSADPSDRAATRTLAEEVQRLVAALVSHAEHEDGVIQPQLEEHLPAIAAEVAAEHEELEGRMAGLVAAAHTAAVAPAEGARSAVHRLYLDLATFTASYLQHQDLEERELMPALEAAVGVPAVMGMHEAIVTSIPPETMAMFMAFMLPAMNVDDRTELLGGMRQGAPEEAFAGIWGLAAAVTPPEEHGVVAARLGIV